jgi:hypothetical protein
MSTRINFLFLSDNPGTATARAVAGGGNAESGPVELYDLKNDPGKTKDVAVQKHELVARAEAMMKAAHAQDPNWPLRSRHGAQPGRSRRQKATIKKVAPVPASPWLPQVQAKPSMRNEKPSEERRYNI